MIFSTNNPGREAMSSVDAAWLRMDRPTNLMMVTILMIFEQRLDFDGLKKTLRTRFLRLHRFTQRPVVDDDSTCYWETDPYFDLDSHLHCIALPGAGDKPQLQELVSDLVSTPLDPSKPRWRFDLVEDYKSGSALVARIHHCYADGIALMKLLLSMADAAPDLQESGDWEEDTDEAGILEQFYAPARAFIKDMAEISDRVLEETVRLLRHPSAAIDYIRKATDVGTELTKVALLPDDRITRFKGRLGVRKRLAWADSLPLEEVKTVGKALDCTVNEILLSCVAGALRSYLLEKGEHVDDLIIKVAVPVNLRSMEEGPSLGNRFGLVFVELPLYMSRSLERLYQVKKNMRVLKDSKQAAVTYGLLVALGRTPIAWEHQAIDLLSNKATAVMTNVPGPGHPIHLAGAKLAQIMFWVPQSGNVGMGVSILSYAGRVQFGLITDKKRVDDPENIVTRFAGEFEKLVLMTLMGLAGLESL